MKKLFRWGFLLAVVFGVAGCDRDAMMERMAPHPETEMGRKALDDWRMGRTDALEAVLADNLVADGTAGRLADMSKAMPHDAPLSVKLLSANWNARMATGEPKQTLFNLAYEYRFEHGYMVGSVVLKKLGDRTSVIGIHAQMNDRSFEQMNAFSWSGKSVAAWTVLLLCCCSVLVCLTAFVLCLRTPMPRRKVWWALFTLVGVVSVSVNWNTGQLGFEPVSFQVFAASVMSMNDGPWILKVSFPLGAVWFLAVRKRWVISPTLPTDGSSR